MSWAAIGAATITVAGSQMGGGGASQSGTSTTQTAPPSYIAGEYDALASQIQDIRQGGLLEDIQTLSPYERSLVERGMTRAAAEDPFQAAGERAVSGLLGGGGLLDEAAQMYRGTTGSTMESPEFLAASQRAVERAMRPVTSQFAAGGRLGSRAFADALADASFGAMSPLALQARQQDISADLSRASGLGSLAGQRTSDIAAGLTGAATVGDMPFTNIQRGLGLGGLLSGEEYALRQAPVTATQRLSDIVRGSTVGSNVTQPLYAPSSGSLAGGALMEAAPQIGQAFGNFMNRPAPPASYNTGIDLGGSSAFSVPAPDFSDLYFGGN
jgi:hypothetical protein